MGLASGTTGNFLALLRLYFLRPRGGEAVTEEGDDVLEVVVFPFVGSSKSLISPDGDADSPRGEALRERATSA